MAIVLRFRHVGSDCLCVDGEAVSRPAVHKRRERGKLGALERDGKGCEPPHVHIAAHLAPLISDAVRQILVEGGEDRLLRAMPRGGTEGAWSPDEHRQTKPDARARAVFESRRLARVMALAKRVWLSLRILHSLVSRRG